jgi:hypothetical protein
MLAPKHYPYTFAALIAAVSLAAGCGPSSTPTAGQPGAGTEAAGGGGEVSIPYVDARFHYRIDGPGKMTPNSDGSAVFIGPSERLEVTIVQGASASDPAALAAQDLKWLASSAQSFHQVSNPATVTISGHRVTRFTYTWNAGTSTVTGKAIALTSVRYYVPKDSTTLAIVTYGTVTNQFDPQGADDIASIFKWQ